VRGHFCSSDIYPYESVHIVYGKVGWVGPAAIVGVEMKRKFLNIPGSYWRLTLVT
jgi:hypothetical protein